MKIPLSGVYITQDEINAVKEVLQSGILSIGPKLIEFEGKIAEYIGVKHAIGVNSGTSGLHLLIRALGIGEGDEVITTPFSFVASSNVMLFEKAIPVFVDIDPNTFNIDIKKIEEKMTEKTKAILVVDVFGHPNDMEKINKIAQKYNLKVIEDSCEALGSEYKGIKSGQLCDGAVFAFYPNKQITTGEGGMIVTNDSKIAELCRSMRSQGRAVTGTWLHHERLGYNYRLSELHAAIGVEQMKKIDFILEKRKKVAENYQQLLEPIQWIETPYIDPDVTHMSWFVYVIRVKKGVDRNDVMEYLKRNGIDSKPYFTPIHQQPFYQELFGYQKGDFLVTDDIADRTIALPFFTELEYEDVQYIANVLQKYQIC